MKALLTAVVVLQLAILGALIDTDVHARAAQSAASDAADQDTSSSTSDAASAADDAKDAANDAKDAAGDASSSASEAASAANDAKDAIDSLDSDLRSGNLTVECTH